MMFLISAHLPDDYAPSAEDIVNGGKIHALNAEIEAAGSMFFSCGLQPAPLAKTVRMHPNGSAIVTDGPYLETKEHIGGFLILKTETEEEALEWARKGTLAMGRPVEVRQIYFNEG
ncbi:YciI family protein [soil metagenome]